MTSPETLARLSQNHKIVCVIDSRDTAESLEAYTGNLLAESRFFSDLSTGAARLEHVRDVFGQFYLWRNRFHRWFGLCVAKSSPFGESFNVPLVLGELIACLEQEIKEDHHGLAKSFLSALGISDPAHIPTLAVTDSYADSFLRCYSPANRSGDEALAALAGRELVGPSRNRIITRALPEHYGVASGLEFFDLHESVEVGHFRVLWDALGVGTKVSRRKLLEAARMEIWEHITFWDDVYSAVPGVSATTKTR